MTDPYVELVENFLASELSAGFDADGVKALEKLNREQFDLFRSQWYTIDKNRHEELARPIPLPTSPQATQTGNASGAANADGTAVSALFRHPYNGLDSVDLELVKRQALLFSKVAVIAPRLGYAQNDSDAPQVLMEHVNGMLEIKPMVDAGVIELIPLSGFYSNEIEGGAAIIRRACTEESDIKAWIASEANLLASFAPSARQGDPFFDAGIRICAALTYGHDLAATHPFVGHLFKKLFTDAPKQSRSLVRATQHIKDIELPGLDQLTWSDIQSVRENEECLATWRADLGVAITSVDPNLPPDEFVQRFDEQVQAQLARAALNLGREIKASSGLARFKKGLNSLLISAVAMTAKSTVTGGAGGWEEVTKVMSKDGAKEAIRFFWEGRSARAKKALRKHYAVFNSK